MPRDQYHEQKFFNALRDIFVGAEIEGESGFINLMRIKSRYYTEGVFPRLKADIDQAVAPFPGFREELFDKLHTFFKRYFSESGSIYFRYTPLHQNVYEKVYTDERDVVLFWKTHMLYYVKTDRIFNSLKVEVDGFSFYFDASKIEHKRANEKRDVVFTFREAAKDGTLVFDTAYSVRGRITKIDDILRDLRKEDITISDGTLEKAFRVFEKQSEVDYFINKNARAFLEEQFDLWLYQYLFAEQNIWSAERLAQLQALKAIAYKVIGFISQFEDELVKIWNKPKFVRGSHYIVTLDHLLSREKTDLLDDLFAHPGMIAQIDEWVNLGMLDEALEPQELLRQVKAVDLIGMPMNLILQYLPIDTRYFADKEKEILKIFISIDSQLDGWLVLSENYQALRTLSNKYQNRINGFYIDPPYNTDASSIIYMNNYKDSTWVTMMENRLDITSKLLNKTGMICVAIDDEEIAVLRLLMSNIFIKDIGLACVRSNPAGRKTKGKFAPAHEFAMFYGKTEKAIPGTLEKTEKSLARYKKKDETGRFAWANFIRSGSNDKREDRPKLYYPIIVDSYDKIRVPKIEWSDERQEYLMLEEPKENETVVLPTTLKDGIITHKNWQRGHIRVKKEIPYGEYRVRRTKDGQVNIDFKTRMDEDSLPITWWDNKKYASANYGAAEIKELFSDRIFDYPKSKKLVTDCIKIICSSSENTILCDYFAGSGTTAHAVMNLNREDGGSRKYILVEMGDHFHEVIVPRIKKIAFNSKWKDGKPVFATGESGMSQFVKVYSLEQYEETLQRVHYEDADLFDDPSQDPYHAYVFLRDLKLLASVETDPEANEVRFHPERLYPDIDLAETLSHLRGKWIKCITEEYVEFEDGERMSLTEPDWETLKPMVWWV